MKTKSCLALVAVGAASLFATQKASAQETVVVTETQVIETQDVTCKTNYYTDKKSNWFIQLGAGAAMPFVENNQPTGTKGRSVTANYNLAFGKWFSPYVGWRISFLGGALHWNEGGFSRNKYVNANLDFMWDMFNSFHGVNTKRVFSIVPFVGLGGTYCWDFNAPDLNVYTKHENRLKSSSWTLPVSAGLQFRFRLCKYADFFIEGRGQFYGDNFNNVVNGYPVDINLTATGGFTFHIGGAEFKSFNPCDYLGYINSLNNQVNDLRGALTTTSAALAAAEAQLPCPEVKPCPEVEDVAPLMSTVRFKLNSAVITNEEAVNVYNIAEWMKANPAQNVEIVGYADKDTGTSKYNMELSKRRAKAVCDMLINKYGISADRLTIQGEGSDVQPYKVNNWNRIVIFSIVK